MKKCIPSAVLIFMLIVPPALSYSQEAQNEIAETPEAPVDTPIDGGLAALLAVGAGYGARKYHYQKKGEKQP